MARPPAPPLHLTEKERVQLDGNEQRSIPMPQSADGQLSVPVTDCAVGPKSGKRLQRLDRFTWRCHARQAEVCGSARNSVFGADLGRND